MSESQKESESLRKSESVSESVVMQLTYLAKKDFCS